MAKFYKNAERLMVIQIVAIACLFLAAFGIIAIPEWVSQYKIHKLFKKRRNTA